MTGDSACEPAVSGIFPSLIQKSLEHIRHPPGLHLKNGGSGWANVRRDLSSQLLQEPPPLNLSHFSQKKEATSSPWWPLEAASTLFFCPLLALLSQVQDEAWILLLGTNADPVYCPVTVSRDPPSPNLPVSRRKRELLRLCSASPVTEKAWKLARGQS